MLSAAMMRFSSLRNENEAITATGSYHEGMKILNEIGDEIRKTAHNLMPDALLKQSLPEAVQAFCSNVHARKYIQGPSGGHPEPLDHCADLNCWPHPGLAAGLH